MKRIDITRNRRLILSSTAIYIAVITALSLINLSPQVSEASSMGLDKIAHFLFYFGLNGMLTLSAITLHRAHSTRAKLTIMALAIAYSIAIEILQSFIGREFDLSDILANSLGAVASFVLIKARRVYFRIASGGRG
ncbi:MAG: VanZ family protein [Rikenellaceae bacterium]